MDAASGASLLTVLVATIASWIFGAIWYMTLAKPWMAAVGLTEEQIKGPGGKQDMTPNIISFVLEFVMAYVLAMLLIHVSDGGFSMIDALKGAFMLWLGFIVTTQTINHRYSKKPWSLTIIDNGHWLGVLLIQAIVMAIMGL